LAWSRIVEDTPITELVNSTCSQRTAHEVSNRLLAAAKQHPLPVGGE
jgi:hypothetical protein